MDLLAVETVEQILGNLSRDDLSRVCRVNSLLRTLSIRQLYRVLDLDTSSRVVLCLVQLSPPLASLVQTLVIDLSGSEPIANLLRLLARTLPLFSNLKHLTTRIPAFEKSVAWLLRPATLHPNFKLTLFNTTMIPSPDLAAFFISQPTITELYFNDIAGFASERPFIIPSSALPVLARFYTTSDDEYLRMFVQGRPVSHITTPIVTSNPSDLLDILTLSATHLQHIAFCTYYFESTFPPLLTNIAIRFPYLKALHFSFICPRNNFEMIPNLSPILAQFTHLRHFAFMIRRALPTNDDTEHAVAKQWHRACPTLRSIALPNCAVWRECGGQWIKDGYNQSWLSGWKIV